jgi:hypothetical protein
VATACCYLESTNVQGGELAFRTTVSTPAYEQNDNQGIEGRYGLGEEDGLVQAAGSCATPQGRILAWRNILQHCVSPVSLNDPNLPGKRTIACFFLVDPTCRVRSTATVPPQLLSWYKKKSEPVLSEKLPVDALQKLVFQYLHGSAGVLDYTAACERRVLLMEERRALNGPSYSGGFFEGYFGLCEH